MDKKEKILEVLKKIYDDTSFISDEEINQINALCDKQLAKDRLNYHIRRDENNYALTEEIRILKSVFEVIKSMDSLSFYDRYKLEQYYEKRLESILQIMDTEEMKNIIPRTPPMDSPNSDYTEEKVSQPTILYSSLPDYSIALANMCADQMVNSQSLIVESKETKISLPSLEKYKKIDLSLKGHNIGYHGDVSVSEESKMIASKTASVITETENKNVEIEQQRLDVEKQKREIELINLQQEINKMENERLEIEKRLRTISSETLESFFSKQISEKYPEVYQQFQQTKEQVRNYSSKAIQISDLKERFNKVAEDLKFYKGMLPVYESYYQKFEKTKNEMQQQRVSENEQERIYNLIHSEENERLKNSRSLYTAWDLGNKTIPPEYQGMSYEQVEVLLNQKQAQEKARQDAQATRDELIGKAIRKDLMVPEDYHLSQIQIKNLSEQFAGYSNEELQKFITGSKKQEVTSEVQSPLATEIIPQTIQQQSAPKIQMQEAQQQLTSSYNDFEKNLISFIETRDSNLGKVLEVISVTGYPDSTYEVRFEDGNVHQITVTEKEKNMIRNQIQNNISMQEQPIQQTPAIDVSTSEISQNRVSTPETDEKNKLINGIIGAMLNAGEFHDSELDISQKMRDIEYAKRQLSTKSIEELEWVLSTYTPQQKEINSTGGLHR